MNRAPKPMPCSTVMRSRVVISMTGPPLPISHESRSKSCAASLTCVKLSASLISMAQRTASTTLRNSLRLLVIDRSSPIRHNDIPGAGCGQYDQRSDPPRAQNPPRSQPGKFRFPDQKIERLKPRRHVRQIERGGTICSEWIAVASIRWVRPALELAAATSRRTPVIPDRDGGRRSWGNLPFEFPLRPS